jgi:hypothetical protein
MAILRAHRGLPKNTRSSSSSASRVRAHLHKTENHYLQDQSKEMPKVDRNCTSPSTRSTTASNCRRRAAT